MTISPKAWLNRICDLPLSGEVRIMNVCGGHERTITMSGLRSLLPDGVELIPGPGCPVCICPDEDIRSAIRLALEAGVILVAFGDMLRVPVNRSGGKVRSLEQARGAGGDVRPVASPMEAVAIARAHPDRSIVFFAAGFETTTAPVAGMLAEGAPANLSVLLSGRLTWPAVAALLDSGDPGFHALVAPGHVSTIMGPEDWSFVVKKHNTPTAVAGFTPVSLLAAFYSVLRQHLENKPFLDNCYPEVVRPGGNPDAKQCLEKTMEVADAHWRGVGTIPASGFRLRAEYAQWDARIQYAQYMEPPGTEAMPPGCDCAGVVLGKIRPIECALYGTACQPRNPVGPCMVSEEGACRIWWAGGARPATQKNGCDDH